jgi:hypothetical protein
MSAPYPAELMRSWPVSKAVDNVYPMAGDGTSKIEGHGA